MFALSKTIGGLPPTLKNLCRITLLYLSGHNRGLKVALIGAAGRVGQPLALMLKNCPLFTELALYDVCSTKGLCCELSHIDTRCKVSTYKGKVEYALRKAHIVVIVACAPKYAGSEFRTMYRPNAPIIFEMAVACARYCPDALIAIATNPVNSMVPLASETLQKFRVYQPNRVFGVTTLDVMRANMFVAKSQGEEPEKVQVPVIGGHCDRSTIPVLSKVQPPLTIENEDLVKITDDVQSASENLGRLLRSDTLLLSAAFAISRFVIALARATRGEKNIIECSYVRSDLYSDLKYLATPVLLGPTGIQKNMGIPPLTDYENCQLQNAAIVLREDIKLGESYSTGRKYKTKRAKPICNDNCLDELDVCNPCT